MRSALILFILSGVLMSCRNLKEYLRDPDTSSISETLHATTLVGYAASVATSKMAVSCFPGITFSRSNTGYPCITVMVIDPEDQDDYITTGTDPCNITVIGLWANESTAVLSLILTDYHSESGIIDVIGIETIPVIRDGTHLQVAMGSQDIKLNPNQNSFFSIDLDSLQFSSELLRLENQRPEDVYIAIEQDAYFIDVDNNNTYSSTSDDTYTITGGGQLIEVDNNSAEIIQQAMFETITGDCYRNPVGGMALVRVIGIEEEGFPDMGTAVLEFNQGCSGKVSVFAATGMYLASNGKVIPFEY